MDDVIHQMLGRYACETANDYRNALKEIIQEFTLFGLWRTKFFDHAAFYGGTALRILYGLDRFSEDLDFTLITPKKHFDLKKYEAGVQRELEAFGLTLRVEVKSKTQQSAIQSAFVKANTLEHLLKVGLPDSLRIYYHPQELMKIKFEVDTDPPMNFATDAKPLFLPAPFSIPTYTLPCMFAGKLSAILFRQWKNRVKGRDWYDLLWFIGKKIPVDLKHLQTRCEQLERWDPSIVMTLPLLHHMLLERIDQIDLKQMKQDVLPFVRHPLQIEGWNKALFAEAVKQIHEAIV